MALTDSGNPSNAQRPVPLPPGARPIPHDELARLPVLHAEAADQLSRGLFVSRAPGAAGLLIPAGAAALALGGGALPAGFVWSLLVLAGIAAMIVIHIRGQARAPSRRIPLAEAAADLRAALLYTGFAWGAGAFLALPAAGLAIAAMFALAPSLMLALLLRDKSGSAAFAAPAILLTAAACLTRPGGQGAALLLLATSLVIVAAAWAVTHRQTHPHTA